MSRRYDYSEKQGRTASFSFATELPKSVEERDRWQAANYRWWEENPMRYDWNAPLSEADFSEHFHAEIDRRFLEPLRHFMPWREIPLDPLIDFAALATKDVLEIGTGNGPHAELLCRYARSYTGIDLTGYAVKSTSERLARCGLRAEVRRMDAEQMDFEDGSFDFIWSWGVIHHSADARRVLDEMHRVLRPGGAAIVMVYHRSLWHTYVMVGLVHGLLRGGLLRTHSLHRLTQEVTDGAIARFYSRREWRRLVGDLFIVRQVRVYGPKSMILPIPGGPLKERLLRLVPDWAARLFTNRLRQGQFLVSTLEKA